MPDWLSGESALATRFEAVVAAADDTTRPDWLATAAATPAVRDRLADLAAVLSDGDVAPGVAYQHLLSDEERTTSSHFATDPALATALCRWAVRPGESQGRPRVLDMATGSGVFSVAAHDRLRTVAPGLSAPDRLGRIVGVDVDPVALAVTAHRLLAAAGVDASTLALYETNFFDVDPSDDRTCAVTGDGVTAGRFDAVVGNPPYARQETTDIERARAHLSAFGPPGETPYADGDRALSRRSDAYVYFVTHATQFLRDGGRLGVVLPAKWLTTQYGESFRRFLFDHYRVVAVVGFGSRAFEDALVDTVLLFAQRCERAETRRATPVRFCRLDEQVAIPTLLGTIEADGDERSGMVVERADGIRTVTVSQSRLAADHTGTLMPYLDAPEPFIRLLAGSTLTPLGEFTTVRRGVMTGANDFFFLDDADAAAIDDRFCSPAIKSIRDVTDRVIGSADTDRVLLDVHEYVESVRTERDGAARDDRSLTAAVREALARDGYEGLRSYVEWGERQGFHERSSCASRRVWFDLGDVTAPAVFVPKFFDERVLVVANPDGLLASNAVDCLWVDDAVDARTLLGVLNTTLTKAVLECWGRSEGGGALQLLTYELSTLPVPDPRTFSPATTRAIADATDALLAGEADASTRLDRLVLDAIGIDMSVEMCRRLRESMVRRRVHTGAKATAPLVDR